MTSGKMYPKPDNAHREHLARRAHKALIEAGKTIGKLSDSEKKSPSQKKSESLRARLDRRGGVTDADKRVESDCRGCEQYSTCRFDHNILSCNIRSMTGRCKQCGQKYAYRVIAEEKWEYCPKCRSEKK